jgi:hypothetical protein
VVVVVVGVVVVVVGVVVVVVGVVVVVVGVVVWVVPGFHVGIVLEVVEVEEGGSIGHAIRAEANPNQATGRIREIFMRSTIG